MGDGGRKKRVVGGVFDGEKVKKEMEEMGRLEEQVGRRKTDTQLKKHYLDLAKTFSEGETVGEREPAARELVEAMNDPETSPEMRRFLQDRNKQHKFSEFMELSKSVKDMSELGEVAQKMANPGAEFEPKRSMQDLIDDPTFDEGCKKVARHFQTYLPKHIAYKNGEDPGFTKGESITQKGGKDVILDKDGGLLMKPGEGDDPRLLGTLVRSFGPLMEKPGRDTVAERQGKSILTDETRGMGYITTVKENPDTSPAMKELGEYMQKKARAFAPERSLQYDREHNTRFQQQQMEVEKPKKKGFFSFGKKDKGKGKKLEDI